MATVEECEQAFHELADRLASAAHPAARRHNDLDRTMSCTLSDLKVSFAGRLRDGKLHDIRQVDRPSAQVKMTMTSEDLLRLVAGELHMGSAFATGRVRIDASIRDLLRLRSIF